MSNAKKIKCSTGLRQKQQLYLQKGPKLRKSVFSSTRFVF